MNTKVGQLFLLGLFLRHYFVDSNIRNLQIGYGRVSCTKKIFFPSYCFHISRFQIIFPCRDIGPATATLDPRPRLWTRDRDIGPTTATLDPRPATISQKTLKAFDTRGILSTPASDVYERLKTNGKVFKIARDY